MKIKKHFASQIHSKIAAVIIAFILVGCSYLPGFNRSKAVKLIEQDKKYSNPAVLTIDVNGQLKNAQMRAERISKEDTVEAATVRARADFMQRHPEIIAIEKLGYMKLYLEKPEIGPSSMMDDNYSQNLGVWHFEMRTELTDKGKSLWTDLNLKVDDEALPIGFRSEPAISGLVDENEHLKSADFTYTWKPTELGKAFDPTSNTFTTLSQDLQDALKKDQTVNFWSTSNNLIDFKTPRKAKAYFQQFDDGWRLKEIFYM